jgi:hypothetical protein
METRQLRSLLNEINQLDQGNERFVLIEKAEKALSEYLVEAWGQHITYGFMFDIKMDMYYPFDEAAKKDLIDHKTPTTKFIKFSLR